MRGVGDRGLSVEGTEGRVRRPGRLGSLSDRERLGSGCQFTCGLANFFEGI